MPYLSSTLSTLPTLPWVYIDEGENRVYLLNFRKVDDEIEHSVYEDYYTYGDLTNLYTDAEANSYLNIANVKSTIFTSNAVQEVLSPKFFQGEQISAMAGTANALYQLIEGVYYQYDSNNSFNTDGSKSLQMIIMPGSSRGRLSYPTPFIFDKTKNLEPASHDFSVFPVVYAVTGLDTSGISNSAVVLLYNTTHGYYCNKTLTPTSNIHTSLISFLPSITLAANPATAFSDSTTTANITANVVYSNNTPYPSAQTKLMLTASAGFLNQTNPKANSVGTTTVYGMGTPITETIIVTAGWPNYLNVANLNMAVANGISLGWSNYQFTDPGTFNFVIPSFTKMKVKVWGGGGGGGEIANGTHGSNSSFTPPVGTAVVGGGGRLGEKIIDSENPAADGAGGIATGGNTNIVGSSGGGTGYPGPAPGPLGGSSGRPGSQYGGAGYRSSNVFFGQGGSGGTGGYAERVYANSEITGNATIVVGTGGNGATLFAGNGAPGGVIVEWI